MTHREQTITKHILAYLHSQDHKPVTEVQVHLHAFDLFPAPKPSSQELGAALRYADGQKWVNGIASKFAGMKWVITDDGEAIRLEMQ